MRLGGLNSNAGCPVGNAAFYHLSTQTRERFFYATHTKQFFSTALGGQKDGRLAGAYSQFFKRLGDTQTPLI